MNIKTDYYVHDTFKKLHSIPEVGFHEYETSLYLANQLEKFGYNVTRNIGTTGVLGVLDSGIAGTNFALRADMDALSYIIDDRPVCIHACGHDANCSMVLTAAKYAAEKRIKKGKFSIVFQQAEEKVGSIQMIETGLLDDINEMIAIHLRPDIIGNMSPAMYTGASYFIDIRINGVTSHGARPQLGVNAIIIASSIISNMNALYEDSRTPYSIKATQIKSIGNEKNTIPDIVDLTVDLRAQSNDIADSLFDKLQNISIQTAKLYGGSIVNIDKKGMPAAEHDSVLIEVAKDAIVSIAGKALPPLYGTGGEDFTYFATMLGIKTAYIGVGANIENGLHHPEMKFDPKALDIGVAVLKKILDMKINY